MLCSINEFSKAIGRALKLFDKSNLESRELSLDSASRIKKLLIVIQSQLKSKRIDSFSELMFFLNNLHLSNRELIPLAGYLGKILDAIQLLKEKSSRNKNAKLFVKSSLSRTGHLFLYDEPSVRKLLEEVVNATALFIFLEVSNSTSHCNINPISTLRNSSGNRLPEEYFSELVAGWYIEDKFLNILLAKKLNAHLAGVDSDHKILFTRPKRNMGDSDITIIEDNIRYNIELQRIGEPLNVFRTIDTMIKHSISVQIQPVKSHLDFHVS